MICSGCTSSENRVKKDFENFDYMVGSFESINGPFTFSSNSQSETIDIDWNKFSKSSKKTTVNIDKLELSYYFDESILNCKPVATLTDKKLKKFIPKSPTITKNRRHSVNILLIGNKGFYWRYPYTEEKSYFAFSVPDCTGDIPAAVHEITTKIYHELFHLYNRGNNLDSKTEEELASATEICSLLTSELAKDPQISGISNKVSMTQGIAKDHPNFDSYSSTTKNSTIGKYTVMYNLYYAQQEFGSFAAACESIYGL